jgi:integrating conjugative element membrane protein (TIGR03747 family)
VATSDDSPRLQAVLWPFKTAFYLWLSFTLLGLLSIAFQVSMAKLVWGVPETTRQVEVFLARDVERTYQNDQPTSLTHLAINGARLGYWMFFKVTQIDKMMRNAATLGNANSLDRGGDILVRNNLVSHIQDEIFLSMYVVQDFAVRIVLLMGAWPLYLLMFSLGLVDGLAERSIRRACAGRESSSLYHRAKYLQFASFVMAGMVYVLLPYSIRPEWFFIPLAGLLLVLSRVQWTYLKKYL